MNSYDFYQQTVKEYFDLTDRKTLKGLTSINEEDQNKVMMNLAGKLYQKIIDKVADIDYGQIPLSKGDITKIPNYMEMVECLDIIRELIIQYKQKTAPLDTINEAIENMKDSKAIWEKGFSIGSNMPIIFYNTIVLSIVSGVSYMISTSIEFIKDPVDTTFITALNKLSFSKTKSHLLLKDLEKFNKAYRRGEVQKCMAEYMKCEVKIKESGVVEEAVISTIIGGVIVTATVIALLGLVLPILHEMVCIFYTAKQSISDYFSIQSDMLMLNAEKVKLDMTKTAEERDKIYKKQTKIAAKFNSIANKLAVKLKSADSQAEKIVKSDKTTKYKISDVQKELPSSASTISTSGIF